LSVSLHFKTATFGFLVLFCFLFFFLVVLVFCRGRTSSAWDGWLKSVRAGMTGDRVRAFPSGDGADDG